ncbi:unnamed protein product [Sympodiomycopsis kandeliae]
MPIPYEPVKFEIPAEMAADENTQLREPVKQLLQRNQSFASKYASDKSEQLATNAAGQAPKVFWIGCADSRVPEGMVCQTDPGEVFTIRNVANQWNEQDDNSNAALTFAVEALGIEDIIVVGHTSCGGVNAAISGCAHGPPSATASTSLGRYLIPLTQLAHDLKTASQKELSPEEFQSKLTTANVKRQIENLKNSEVIKRNWSTGESTLIPGKVCTKVRLHGFIHDVSTGKLHDLHLSACPEDSA